MDRLQADIIDKGLKENPFLKPHAIPILNSQLNTLQKDSLIKAINEIYLKMNTIDNSLNTFMVELFEIIGNWKNNPDLKDGVDLMAGTLLESLIYLHNLMGVGGLKRTVVFYFQNYAGGEKVVEIYVPYKGKLDRLYLSISEDASETLEGVLVVDEEEFEITIPVGEKLASIELDGEFTGGRIKFKILSGEEGLEGINASLDFIQG